MSVEDVRHHALFYFYENQATMIRDLKVDGCQSNLHAMLH